MHKQKDSKLRLLNYINVLYVSSQLNYGTTKMA